MQSERRNASAISRAAIEHRQALNRKLRAADLAGAEERSMKQRGRGLTATELRRVMRRYPGDLPEE